MKFSEFEISNFLGEASSTRQPQKNECQKCLNFDTRYVFGDLTLRTGFSQKYAAPVSADHRGKLSNITYLDYETFYIPDGGGQEVTVWVAKATLTAETTTVLGVDPPTRNIIALFSSHQFNGTSWVQTNYNGDSGKYWLNHTIVTSLAAASTDNECELNFADAAIITGNILNNWTIINITKSPYEVAQVIDTYDWVTGVGVKITNNSHDWDADDIIILMKNYIPYDSLIAMYNCTADDITFHKVLDDLRIGFGGQEDRIGLSIGYRKNYLKLSGIDFGSFSSFYQAFSTIDNIVLDTYSIIKEDNANSILLSTKAIIAANQLATGKYYFRMTALLDDFNEILVAENSIVIQDTGLAIGISPRIKAGICNKRVTKFKVYVSVSTDDLSIQPDQPYFFLSEYSFRETTYISSLWKINIDGFYYLDVAAELHANGDPSSPGTDGNTLTAYTYHASLTVTADNAGPAHGTWWVKAVNGTAGTLDDVWVTFTQANLFLPGKSYIVSVKLKTDNSTDPVIYAHFMGERKALNANTTWKQIVESGVSGLSYDTIKFQVLDLVAGKYFGIDELSIKEFIGQDFDLRDVNNTDKTEMSDNMGYLPSFDMIRSWDQAIVTQGRTFFVNPYIDKRWENKIFRSHISGAGAFMYDTASAGEQIDLENFDGNSLTGVEVLPNMWFIALKTNGSQLVDPNTGATKKIDLGYGCKVRKSIRNFGDRVIWCGEDDIYMSDGFNTVSIADRYIREAYRALTENQKLAIIATRDEKDNAYRFFTGNTTSKIEYILTKKGWIRRSTGAALYPQAYSIEQSGEVTFMYGGVIYNDDDSISDRNAYSIIGEWQSVDIDAELIGEGLTERDFIFIRSVWVYYTRIIAGDDPNMRVILTVDGVALDPKDFRTVSGQQKEFIYFGPAGVTGKRFNIEIQIVNDENQVVAKHISIHSVGIMWKKISSGRFN